MKLGIRLLKPACQDGTHAWNVKYVGTITKWIRGIRMKILIACEESQAVCIALRERGHEAYSCDILPCSGGHPEWHIQDDVFRNNVKIIQKAGSDYTSLDVWRFLF